MWEVIAAVIATALGIVVLPFATSVASNWLDDHRADRKRRRELYEKLEVLAARGSSMDTALESQEVRPLLFAQMGPRDRLVRKATWKALTYGATQEENDVLRYWVFGHSRAARKLAKKLVTGSSTSQSPQSSPPPGDKSEG